MIILCLHTLDANQLVRKKGSTRQKKSLNDCLYTKYLCLQQRHGRRRRVSMLGFYRIRIRSKKFCIFFHFQHLRTTNSWLLFRRAVREALPLRDFKLAIMVALCSVCKPVTKSRTTIRQWHPSSFTAKGRTRIYQRNTTTRCSSRYFALLVRTSWCKLSDCTLKHIIFAINIQFFYVVIKIVIDLFDSTSDITHFCFCK